MTSSSNGSNQRNYPNGQEGLGGFESKSRKSRDEPNEAINSNSQRDNQHRKNISRRRIVAGGILSQLIAQCEDQLAYLDNQQNQIRERIAAFEKLRKSLASDNENSLLLEEE